MNMDFYANSCIKIPNELKKDIIKTDFYNRYIAHSSVISLDAFWDAVEQYKKTLNSSKYSCFIKSYYFEKNSIFEMSCIFECKAENVGRLKSSCIHKLIKNAHKISKLQYEKEKNDQIEVIENKSIYDLNVSERAINCLRRNNCETIGDVLRKVDNIPNWRNCGIDTHKNIINALIERGCLAQEQDVDARQATTKFEKIQKQIEKLPNDPIQLRGLIALLESKLANTGENPNDRPVLQNSGINDKLKIEG